MSVLNKIFKSYSEKEVKRVKPIVNKINGLEEEMTKLTDNELRAKTEYFKGQLKEGKTLDDILPEAFAVVREASKRVLGMRHFDVQLIGGIILHQGRIAEMKTGEGKTLVATLPVYLNALEGKGVHVITVNDYLAKRDSEWMGKLYKFLGLSVGLVIAGMEPKEKQEAYNADITYGTNNEFGFDYLRDNMVIYKDQLVQRGLHYAIIDEIDSILIDEARTPLIISGRANESSDLYKKAENFVSRLTPKVIVEEDVKDFDQAEDNEKYDYIVDLKAKSASLTQKGIKKAEDAFGLENFNDLENSTLVHHVNQALRAHGIMKKDIDYIVKDGEVLIVDEFTGRIMYGRRYNNGLHQAIEAKEKVKIADESKTLATITFQNFFRMYSKLAGMTGTAKTEEEEFKSIYKMDVVQIPTNKPVIRQDLPDVVYKNEHGKFHAVAEDIMERHKKNQPVLVGTVSIEKSELLSQILKRKGVKHEVLNAKNHEKEAEIIAQAGRLGAVTIATNMAGRGTDIMLGGNPLFLTKKELKKHGFTDDSIKRVDTSIDAEELAENEDLAKAKETFEHLYDQFKEQAAKEQEEVKAAGGLAIIGTERHESRRIDNQLRGRSGRQGDPGSSRFYIGLDDDLMRLFGSDRIKGVVERIGLEDDMPIEHKMLTKSIENAQKKVEGRNFGIRKHVLQYDDVMNKQRQVIYAERSSVLEGEDIHEYIQSMVKDRIAAAVEAYTDDKTVDYKELKHYLYGAFMPAESLEVEGLEALQGEELIEKIYEIAFDIYKEKEEIITPERMREIERIILLQCVDNHWIDHIDAMDQLRQGIGLRALGQQDPVIAYKLEGFNMFDEMVDQIRQDTVRYLFGITIEKQPTERKQIVDVDNIEAPTDEPKQPVVKETKVGRNDPCPCGSGKKYKNCCGKN